MARLMAVVTAATSTVLPKICRWVPGQPNTSQPARRRKLSRVQVHWMSPSGPRVAKAHRAMAPRGATSMTAIQTRGRPIRPRPRQVRCREPASSPYQITSLFNQGLQVLGRKLQPDPLPEGEAHSGQAAQAQTAGLHEHVDVVPPV